MSRQGMRLGVAVPEMVERSGAGVVGERVPPSAAGTMAGEDRLGAAGTGLRRRHRRAGECRLCGSAPAVPVDLRSQSGGVLRSLLIGGPPVERGPLCRACGLAVLRDLTDVALCGGTAGGRVGSAPSRRPFLSDLVRLGWLVNLLTVVGNLSFWWRLRRLAAPCRDPEVDAPLDAPLDPGPALWRRRGAAVLAVAAVAVTLAVIAVHHVVTTIEGMPRLH
jgi:hypothetical protein